MTENSSRGWPRPIDTTLHGATDYSVGTTLMTVFPNLVGINGTPAATQIRVAGAVHAGYSTITDYPLGVVKAIPYRVHLALDALGAVALAATPFVTGQYRKGPSQWVPHVALCLVRAGLAAADRPDGLSYGANVISTAAIGNDQVKALVFLNGWMCDEGESQQELRERFEGSLVGPSVRPVPFTSGDGSEGADLFLAPEAFRAAFAADVDQATADVMAAAQRPYAAAAFAGAPSDPPAWRSLPCWYLLGTEDKAIPPALQRFMAERANATIVEVPASHVSFVSQPEAATQLILEAVEAITPAASRA